MRQARTEIIATLGPASGTRELVRQLRDAGVDVFRVNLSHGTRETHRHLIRLGAETGAGVMIDLSGPKIRVEDARPALPLELEAGQAVLLTSAPLRGPEPSLRLPAGIRFSAARVGARILIDDGNIELVVEEVGADSLRAIPSYPVRIGARKGVAFSDGIVETPDLVEDDRSALVELLGEPFTMIAASFVRAPGTITAIRGLLAASGRTPSIVAKIEDAEGLASAEAILEVADGLVVARGDLGVSMPIASLPLVQKRLVALGNYLRKRVIVATQMLESMTTNPRPTRAEVTDVANAVLDGADGLMLSGETAVGRHPVAAVSTMAEIIHHAEEALKGGFARRL